MKRIVHEHTRVFLLTAAFIAAFVLAGYRLIVLAGVQHEEYTKQARAQSERATTLVARGNIFFQNAGDIRPIAAVNRRFPFIVVHTSNTEPELREGIADALATVTGASKDSLITLLARENKERTLPYRLTEEQARVVADLELPGIGIAYALDREYPSGTLAADVLGFVGYNEQGRAGQYGIESRFEDALSGSLSRRSFFAVTNPISIIRSLIGGESARAEESDQPRDIILTLDHTIQAYVENALDSVITKWKAVGGSAIVQDPRTGRILAMVDRPTFNPNEYRTSKTEAFLNSSVQNIFEPGSTFKPFTMAAGLDTNALTPQTTYYDTGSVEVADRVIKNSTQRPAGTRTMTQVLELSLNTGTVFAAKLIGAEKFREYMVNLGFGQPTGIDLPGEVSGDISNLYSGREINTMTASFGQGIAVTPIQLVNALSAIANGGRLMRPLIVDRIITGTREEIIEPEVVTIPFSERTASRLQTMLTSVIDNGYDAGGRIAGYDIAGKTGTAQISGPDGKYLDGIFIHTFIGFAPSYDARYTVLLKLDRPQGVTYASNSLVPTFKDIMQFLLTYGTVPPSRR
ncbi:MAG: penicillin-binding protein 2 [Patescibacteria group bacterium]